MSQTPPAKMTRFKLPLATLGLATVIALALYSADLLRLSSATSTTSPTSTATTTPPIRIRLKP